MMMWARRNRYRMCANNPKHALGHLKQTTTTAALHRRTEQTLLLPHAQLVVCADDMYASMYACLLAHQAGSTRFCASDKPASLHTPTNTLTRSQSCDIGPEP